MSYIEKIKKLFDGKLPKSFSLHMKYMEFDPSEKEEAAKDFFQTILQFPERKKKAKQLGLV